MKRKNDIHLMPEDKPISIHEAFYVDELNTDLADLFGSDAVVEVVLYTNVRKKTRKLVFPLAKGKDVFARDGSLMHDSFIAAWIGDKSAPFFLGGEDCSGDL